jgi:hypothetical protein
VRLFHHVVEALSRGQQPDPLEIADIGHLMRTTAVYGSGKFGAADRSDRRPSRLAAPFIEMLTVWLIRAFTVDIRTLWRWSRRAESVSIATCAAYGVGNSTGLEHGTFVRHPFCWFSNWMMARRKLWLAFVRKKMQRKPPSAGLR